MYYFLIFIIISAFSFLELTNVSYFGKKYSSVLIVVILILTAGLRYETGVDWLAYTELYSDTPPISEITDSFSRSEIFSTIDYGYALFMSITKFFGGTIQTIFFIMSFCSATLIYKGLKNYTELKTTALLLYFSLLFFILDMSGVRQCFALALFFFSIKYIFERKLTKYLLIILLAASFHWSAYFLLPLYFIINRNFSSIKLTVFFATALGIFILNVHWLENTITRLFPNVENAILSARLLNYTSNNYAAARELSRGTIISIFFYISAFSLIIYYRKKLESRYKYFNIFFNIYMCQIFTFFYMYEFAEMADRLRLYFLVSNIIIVPCLAFLFFLRTDRIIFFFYIFLFSFFSCQPWILNSPMTIAYSPYQNYLLYKLFGIESTGPQRLEEQSKLHD